MAPHTISERTILSKTQPSVATVIICLLLPLIAARPEQITSQSKASSDRMSAEKIFARFANRILFLTCDVGSDETKQASGVLVSGDGFVATNAHVVDGCHRLTATYLNGDLRQSFTAVPKYYDFDADVAIVKINEKGLPYFNVSLAPIHIGEPVFSIGNPRGFAQTISQGIVSGIRLIDDQSWIQHSASISPGSSGGALISSTGRLLGINSFLLTESQNLNFGVPVSALARAIAGAQTEARNLPFPVSPRAQQSQERPAELITLFKSREYLRVIQLEHEKLSAGTVTAKDYALIGASYCQLNQENDAAIYTTQALIQLHEDDSYLQSALYCQLRILTIGYNSTSNTTDKLQLRPTIATNARKFLMSSQSTLDPDNNFVARRWVGQISDELHLLSGEWTDETGIFYRALSQFREPAVHIEPDQNNGYIATIKDDLGAALILTYIASSRLAVLADHLEGDFAMTFALTDDIYSHHRSTLTQTGLVSLQLSEDTMSLSGTIRLDPAQARSTAIQDIQQLMPFGTFPVRLTRR